MSSATSMDQGLHAMKNAFRREILQLMKEEGRPVGPKQAAQALGQQLSNTSYHFEVLSDCGVIDLVATEPVRGAVRHLYQPNQTFMDQAWVQALLA